MKRNIKKTKKNGTNGHAKKERVKVTDESFVQGWQEASDLKSFVAKSGLSYGAATQRAVKLRAGGVKLKKFSRLKKFVDYKKLQTIAEKHAPKKTASKR